MSVIKVIISSLLILFTITVFAQQHPPNELNLLEQFNQLQFHDSQLIHKIDSVIESSSENKVTIVHFGDSHIQAEWPTSVTRSILQGRYGNAGYGMIFPYSAAKTYSSKRYKSIHVGNWVFGKSFQSAPNVLMGITGMGVSTDDVSSSLAFKFNDSDTVSNVLKFFLPTDSSMFDFLIDFGDTLVQVNVLEASDNEKSFIEVPIPGNLRDFSISFTARNDRQNKFELYGISVESLIQRGILYHSVGVGAAPYKSVLRQQLLDTHLIDIEPDIVILDFGTNDYLYNDKIDAKLSNDIVLIIKKMRMINPDVTVVLTSAQDLYYKGRHVKSGVKFRNLIRSISESEGCLFWDWYSVSGGSKSLLKWKSKGYCQKDLIHLTVKGYAVKGELLANAITSTLDSLKLNPNIDTLLFSGMDSLYKYDIADKYNYSYNVNTDYFMHRIRPGETLGGIAMRYRTSVKAIMRLNNMRTTLIVVGRKLKIPGKGKSEPITKRDTNTRINRQSNKSFHTVKSGESLYTISQKYGVTVPQLKKINKLKSNTIYSGNKLQIP